MRASGVCNRYVSVVAFQSLRRSGRLVAHIPAKATRTCLTHALLRANLSKGQSIQRPAEQSSGTHSPAYSPVVRLLEIEPLFPTDFSTLWRRRWDLIPIDPHH
ncbi:hypothetical protein LIA77_07624 [Sarocladium implicatum]|nr:hypothetical protein LIA77_07624 [Sarocladium implicatum]